MSEGSLQLSGVAAQVGGRTLFSSLCLQVGRGESVSVVGPSGCGKTTLLRLIAGLTQPTEGRITLDGLPIRTGDVGLVFQDLGLWPHLPVLRNITLAPRSLLGRTRRQAEVEAMVLLERLGIGHLARRSPGNLSGGEAQRVAIARSLAMAPRVLLLDEPATALDPDASAALASTLRNLATSGLPLIVVSHQRDFATAVADRVLTLRPDGLA